MRTWGRSIAVAASLGALAAWLPASASASSWRARNIDGTRALKNISCDFSGFCGAVDASGRLLYASNAPSGTASWKSYQLDRNPGVVTERVSCYSSLDCAAVDSGGNSVQAENRRPWVQASKPVDPGHKLTGISCVARGEPTQGFCGAVDARGEFVATDDPLAGDSATWSSPVAIDGSTRLTAIACPSSLLCVAADSAGRILVSGNPSAGAESAWKAFSTDAGHTIKDVNCVTKSPASNQVAICAAVDASGSALVSTKPAAGIWKVMEIDSRPLTGVSCAGTSMCVAVDNGGHALASPTPTGQASSWTSTHIGSHALTSVSCLQLSRECAAVDRVGNVYTTTSAL